MLNSPIADARSVSLFKFECYSFVTGINLSAFYAFHLHMQLSTKSNVLLTDQNLKCKTLFYVSENVFFFLTFFFVLEEYDIHQ